MVKALIRQFQPYLKLVDANAVKVGTCLTGAVPPVPTHGGPDNNRADGSSDTIFHGIIPSADYLLTFIIPAVIITCMLILAILLACMLHKKRKAGTLNNIISYFKNWPKFWFKKKRSIKFSKEANILDQCLKSLSCG